MVEELRKKLSEDLKNAMREKDVIAVSTIRTLMGRIDNAGAVPVALGSLPVSGAIAGARSGVGSTEMTRRELTREDITMILREEIEELERAFSLTGATDQSSAVEITRRITILRKYETDL